MKRNTKRLLALLCALTLVAGLVPAAVAARPMDTGETVEAAAVATPAQTAPVPSGDRNDPDSAMLAASPSHTIWVVGDSTVCDYAATDDATYYYKRCGYGTKLADYMSDGYTVRNLALSGRSSKSFLSESNYTTLTNGIQAGDILVIGFGHNDEKTEADRYTSPTGDYQTEGSFAKSLYDNYVSKAKAKGAEVILCTPIVRHHGVGKSWSDGNLHIANGGSYVESVIKLGADTNTAVVDLTTLTKELYERLDAAEANSSTKLHAWTQDDVSSIDTTHINKYGAKWVAYTLAKDVINSTDSNMSSTLKAAFTLAAGEPTAADLAAAATVGWTAPEYTAPNLPTDKSAIWPNYEVDDAVFYGTAFGSLGGNPSTNNYTMGKDSNGNMQFTYKALKGKVADKEEGFVMYFVPVPAGKTFTLKATATYNGNINPTSNPNQAAFGLMARDAIWIDKNDKACMSDYVVAGTLGNGSVNCFRRKSGKFETPTSMNLSLKEGDSYELSIVGNTDGYACTFGDQTPQSGGYDYALTTMDPDYVYVGMFVARSISATFSDIYLEIDGEILCDPAPEEGELEFAVKSWTVENGVLESITAEKTGISTNAMGFAVVYSAAGKMTGIKSVRIKPGKIPVGLKLNEGDTAKVFVLGTDTLTPLVKVSSFTSGTPSMDPCAVSGRIKVWDFAAKEEANTDVYDNRVTPAFWSADGKLDAQGQLLDNAALDMDGLILNACSNERLYTTVAGLKSYADADSYCKDFGDGYTSAGGIYMSGAGADTRRYLIVKDVKAGDKIIAYMGSSSNGPVTFCAGSVTSGIAASQEYTAQIAENAYAKVEYVAKKDGDFKIWPASGEGKPFYMRVMLLEPAEG